MGTTNGLAFVICLDRSATNGDYTSATPFMAHNLPAGLKVAFFHFVATASNVSLDMHMLLQKMSGGVMVLVSTKSGHNKRDPNWHINYCTELASTETQ